jgi:hypothetical protein
VGVKVEDGPGRTVVCKKIGKKTVWQLLIMSSTQVQQVPSKSTPSTTPTPTPTEVAGGSQQAATPKIGGPCYSNGQFMGDGAGKVLYCVMSGNKLVWEPMAERLGCGGGSQGATAPSAGKNANPNACLDVSQLYSQSNIYSKHGTVKFTNSPIDLNSIGFIEPIGFTGSRIAPADSIFDPAFNPETGSNSGRHTLPSDHGGPHFKNFEDNVNFHPTFAVADGTIVAVLYQRGWEDPHPGTTQRLDSYGLIFQYTKNFFLLSNHFTQLEPTLLKQIGSLNGLSEKLTDIPVKGGQLLGMTGGATNIGGFDFSVQDMDSKALPCTISPTMDFRAHSVDPYQFFVEPLRSQLYAKLPPRPEPRAGQWCYNIAGKLVGNWHFYYHGTVETYEAGLGFFYDVFDPSKILIGDTQTGRVYTVNGNAPDPATIDVNSGLIKYALTDHDSRNTDTGVMLVQMTDTAKIKMELFPGASADQVTGFTSAAQQLYR